MTAQGLSAHLTMHPTAIQHCSMLSVMQVCLDHRWSDGCLVQQYIVFWQTWHLKR